MASFDLYQVVTDKIIASIENGVLPWVKPWDAKTTANHNVITKKPYQGINTILTAMSGFNSNQWGTFAQWQSLGATVKKGAKATMIVYASKIEKTELKNGIEVDKSFFMMRYFNVFNADQVDGYTPKSEPVKAFNSIEACEKVLAPWADKITYSGNRAFYMPSMDSITMPAKESFNSAEGFYSTAFHELAHLTGHESRLNRDFSGRFGTESYAFEELIAELASSFINASCGLDSIANHDSYIASWLKVLKNDKKAIFTASKEAQKAANMVLGESLQDSDNEQD